jgi:hypothetical protein
MLCIRYPGPARARFTTTFALAAVAGVLLFGPSLVRAADVETRTFTVSVDGKKAGDYQMVVQRQADGSLVMSGSSDVRVTLLAIPVYTYSYRGREVWKGVRLQQFQSSGKEKGKEFNIRANADGSALRIVANGQERRARPDVWTTSIWQLPDARFRNNAVPLLGCDTGAEFQGRLEFVGNEQVQVAGQTQTCAHYRVMKDVPHDVWYDAQERMVRDEWVSGGHRTVLEMVEKR